MIQRDRHNRSVAKVTVAIVSFNTRDLLRRCLASLVDADEVIVVDNASADGSAHMVCSEFPDVRLIENSTNLGFGAANNRALDVAAGELVLLLNSDAMALPGSICRLAAAFDDPDVVAVGGRLEGDDGHVQPSAARRLTLWAVLCEQLWLEKLFPHSRWFSPYWVRSEATVEVEQVMGACLMMRRAERFDERFFLYCEDTDLCRRLRRHGRILYLPEARFVHTLGASSVKERWRAVARYNRGKELYFRIHHGAAAQAAAWLLNRLGALLRMIAWCLAARPSQARLWVRVLFAPTGGPR